MNISSVQVGDMIQADVKGRIFHAIVVEVGADLEVDPIERGVTWRHITSRQVIGHWRKAGRMRPNRKTMP